MFMPNMFSVKISIFFLRIVVSCCSQTHYDGLYYLWSSNIIRPSGISRRLVWQKFINASKKADASIFLKRMSPKHYQVYTKLYGVTLWKMVIFVATSHFCGHVARRIVIRKLHSKI